MRWGQLPVGFPNLVYVWVQLWAWFSFFASSTCLIYACTVACMEPYSLLSIWSSAVSRTFFASNSSDKFCWPIKLKFQGKYQVVSTYVDVSPFNMKVCTGAAKCSFLNLFVSTTSQKINFRAGAVPVWCPSIFSLWPWAQRFFFSSHIRFFFACEEKRARKKKARERAKRGKNKKKARKKRAFVEFSICASKKLCE